MLVWDKVAICICHEDPTTVVYTGTCRYIRRMSTRSQGGTSETRGGRHAIIRYDRMYDKKKLINLYD